MVCLALKIYLFRIEHFVFFSAFHIIFLDIFTELAVQPFPMSRCFYFRHCNSQLIFLLQFASLFQQRVSLVCRKQGP